MTGIEKINLNIDEKALNYAKIYASLLLSEYQRKRAYASISALYSFLGLLDETELDVQKTMTLFRNPVLNEQFEISDLYVNNWHLDVRVIIGGDSFLIPKIHFDNGIQPDFYVVIKMDSSLKTCELLGFADTKKMSKEAFDYGYYSSPISELISYKEFLTAVSIKKVVEHTQEDHEAFKEQYLSLIDNEIDVESKNKIIKHLFECSECRTEFCCFTGFEMVSCHIGEYSDLLKDETLNIVGAQDVDNPKYEGKEQVISFVDEEKEDEVSDILDELFGSDDEMYESYKDDSNKDLQSDIDEKAEDILIDDIEEESNISDTSFDDIDEIETAEVTHIKSVSDELELFDEPMNESEIDSVDMIENDFGSDFENSAVKFDEQPYPHKDLQDDDLLEIQETEQNELSLMDNNESDLVEIKDDDFPVELMDVSEEVLPTLQSDVTDEVQKVIVDYDANGQPIFSYITNISSTDAPSEAITEIVSIEDEIEDKIEDSEDWEKTYDEHLEEENTDVLEDDIFDDEDFNEIENSDSQEVAFEENNEHTIEKDELFENESDLIDYDDEETDSVEQEEEDVVPEEDFFDEEEQSDVDDNSDFEFNDGIDNEDEYEEYDEDESEYQQQKGGSKKGLLIAFFTVILMAAAGVAFFFAKNINSANNETVATENTEVQAEVPQVDDLFEQPVAEENTNENPVSNEEQNVIVEENNDVIPSELPKAEPTPIEVPASNVTVPEPQAQPQTQTAPIGDMNKVMSNVFATQNSVTLRGVNWQCAPALFTNKEFKTYLQGLDDVLKLNIKKNLLNTSDIPQNPSVTVKMAIDNNGQMIKNLISESSGSEQIDNIVLQSINQTLEVQKSQILTDGAQKADKYFLQVVVKL